MADYLGFLISQVHHVEPQAYAIQYPAIQYRRLVPVDTSAAEWARGITHFSTDKVGEAQPLNHLANDMPLVEVNRFKHEVGVEMAGIGYYYTIEELGQAMMVPGTNLTSERAAAAIRATEEYLDKIVLYGSDEHNWDGLINNANVTAVDAAMGAANSRLWTQKTADEIIADINYALTGVWESSLTVEMADTICLPVSALSHLANTRIPDTQMNIMGWVMQYNLYTMRTGRPLMIDYIRGLENAASGNTGRMIAYSRDPMVLRLHLPMPQRFLAPMQMSAFRYDVPGMFRTGGLEIRRPAAVRYVDGITT